MTGGTSVEIPGWIEDATRKYLTQGLGRANDFGRTADNRMGDKFWKNNARNVLGPSQPEMRALDIYKTLGQRGMADIQAGRQMISAGTQQNPWQQKAFNLFSGGPGSNLKKANVLLNNAGQIAKEQVTGKNLGSDPAIAEAKNQFSLAMTPMIQNQAALAGLGRSTAMTNALASQQAQTLLPLIQGGLQREERGIDRRYADATGRANQLFGMDMSRGQALGQGGAQRSSQLMQGGGMRLNLADTMFNRGQTQAGGLAQQGAALRGVRQEGQDAKFNDLMRRFAAYEGSIGGPMSMLGGMMGSKTSKF